MVAEGDYLVFCDEEGEFVFAGGGELGDLEAGNFGADGGG